MPSLRLKLQEAHKATPGNPARRSKLSASCLEPTLCRLGDDLLRNGRLTTLREMLDELAPAALQQSPPLLFILGELARLRSRFQEALGWYRQAEALWQEHAQIDGVSRALRGQARVYLDTVNPAKAEELLQ